MLYREIIAVCSQIHTKHINTPCGQNVELLNIKLVVHIVTTGLYCNFRAFQTDSSIKTIQLNVSTNVPVQKPTKRGPHCKGFPQYTARHAICYNVTLKRVRATMLAEEQQNLLHTLSVCL